MGAGVPKSQPRGLRSSGFQGQIKGASLGDLVQMECLTRARRVFRVTSGDDVGYLYFRDGAIVHAISPSHAGEAAALDILSWREGSFESIDREWPALEGISCTWQSLVLRAAQLQDEQHLPAALREARSPMVPVDFEENVDFEATPIEMAGHVFRREDFEFVLRLDPNGGLVASEGGSQDLADAVAYACRLADLVGDQLGMERCFAIECTLATGRCFVVVEPDGAIVAARPRPGFDTPALREALGI